MEEITKSLQTSDLLVSDLRELASKSIREGNTALNILARDMLESAVKIMQRLNELETCK
jgi:hypothetical protein